MKDLIPALISTAIIILFTTDLDDQVIQNYILAATAITVCYYTYETYRLREETQKQTDLMIQPCLNLSTDNGKIYVQNIGKHLALNVHFLPIYDPVISDNGDWIKNTEIKHVIKPDAVRTEFVAHRVESPSDDLGDNCPITEGGKINKGGKLKIEIEYQNASLQKFRLYGCLSKECFEFKKLEKL